MRRYDIISVILLTLPIIDFAVAAPVLQKKHQAGIDVVHIPEHSITILRKRFDDLSELWPTLFRDSGQDLAKLDDFARPESSPAARPSSSSHPSEPADGRTDLRQPPPSETADGRTDLRQPPPSIPEVPSLESNPVYVPPSPSDAWWSDLFDDSETDTESDTRSGDYVATSDSSVTSSPPSSPIRFPLTMPLGGWTDLKQPLASIPEEPEEPSPVSSPDHGSPSPSDERKALWRELFGDSGSSSSSPPSGTADGRTDVNQPLQTTPGEQSPVSSPDHASPSSDDERNALWRELFGDSGSSSAGYPSSSSSPSGTADGGTDLKQHSPSISEEPSPVGSLTGYELTKGDGPPGSSSPASPTMSSADQELMGAHELLPGPSTEMVDVPPSNTVTSTNPYSQGMSSGSPSSGKRKRPW